MLVGDGGVGKTTFVKRHKVGVSRRAAPRGAFPERDPSSAAHLLRPLPIRIQTGEFEKKYVATVGAEVHPMDFTTNKVRLLCCEGARRCPEPATATHPLAPPIPIHNNRGS